MRGKNPYEQRKFTLTMEGSPSSNEYYIVVSGEKKGPFAQQSLENMSRQGELSQETLVWTDGMTDWQPARTVLPGLFAGASSPPLSIATPGQRVLAGLVDVIVVEFIIGLIMVITAGFGAVLQFGFPLVIGIYEAVMTGTIWQGNVGKKLFGLKTVDYNGNKPTTAQCWTRGLGALISWAIFGIGVLFVFFTERHQTMHDLLANTLVTKEAKA